MRSPFYEKTVPVKVNSGFTVCFPAAIDRCATGTVVSDGSSFYSGSPPIVQRATIMVVGGHGGMFWASWIKSKWARDAVGPYPSMSRTYRLTFVVLLMAGRCGGGMTGAASA